MTYYIQYKGQSLTAHERASGELSLRFTRLRHKTESMLIQKGDVLRLTDKKGNLRVLLKVRAFVPFIRYGTFTRSGLVVEEWREEV